MSALLVALSVLLQSPHGADTVRMLARDGADSALIRRTLSHPDDARDALRRLLADAGGEAPLAPAERLADAYAIAWGDSFFVRQVSRFRALSPSDRRAKIVADSLRLAGNAALGSSGIDAAMRIWRESLGRFERLADTAGMGAALGNLGVGFYRAELYDSADVYLARSRDLAEAIGDYRTLGNAVGTLGSVSKDRGDLRRATELYTRASELRERTGDTRGLAADRNNLGLIAEELGDLAAARAAYEAALAANRSAGRMAPAAPNLENLGNLGSLEGDYAGATARYREALAIYRELGNRLDAAQVLHNLGLLAMRRGDYRAAITTLREAVAIYRRTGPVADEIVVRRSLANARAAVGDLQGARAELQRGDALAGAESSADLALARGDLAVQFNRLVEAERHYARAQRLARGDDETRAAAQQGLGLVLLIRESYKRAVAVLELALRAQQASGDSRAAALTRLLIGFAHRESSDTAAARRVLMQALDTLHRLDDAAGEAAALGALADLDREAGLPLTAESLYRRGLARLVARPAPNIAWQLHAGWARALRSRSALDDAAAQLRAGVAEIERVSAGLTGEERRAAFLADKWDVYVELSLVERTRGRAQAAFEVSEQLRARQLLDLLARGRVAAPGDARDPTAREQDLRRRIDELTRQIETADGERELRGPGLSEGAIAAREALARAQGAYSDLLVELREAHPAYAALVRGDIAPASDVMRALAPDEALLEYLVGDSTTVVFVVTTDTLVALDLNVGRPTLAALIDFARGTLASPIEGATQRAWRAPMRRLFQYLVAPVEATGLLGGKRRLLIAPHAELHYLPFAALLAPGTAGQPLVTRYTLEYVPSASVWLRLRSRPAPPADAGVLALAPRATALPGSQAEVAAIGRIHGAEARVLIGPQASERAFRTLAPGRDIVHLATYGVLNKHNPLFSFVELGAGGGEDGRLEVHEVFGLTLNARLLVLSACQTGLAAGALADVPPGDDWVGLVHAFLFAGASNVVATLWPVQDLATARFMERFYQELAAGRREAEALALAQRAAARDRGTAHPFFWAGFALVAGR
ncbi:MAG TPA: CHAT domain-containing protein [Gemmatimonadales bacterium]|jgi:CHAT domain-containing protein|nr:CHAT domain-containing protein [Gemmatimonadales bacterium]